MTGIRWLWALLIAHTGLCTDIQFLERLEGESAVLPCVVELSQQPTLGVYLQRRLLQPGDVLFMLTGYEPTLHNDEDQNRFSISGDPSTHSVNVTISQLRVTDMDHYSCEFVLEKSSDKDIRFPGKTEFFLLVRPDAPEAADIGLVETCSGGSAMLPCLGANREGSAVEAVSLKRWKGSLGKWEVLYHSKHHHSSATSSFSSSSSSHFPAERVHLSTAPGPGGFTYNLSLQRLQPEESGLYSCQLLLLGKPDATALGRKVFFLSVQGHCGCSRYPALLYALSAAVAALLLLLGSVLVYFAKLHRSVKPRTLGPIYEEMSGLKTSCKLPPLQEAEFPSSKNHTVKKPCLENHYESPSGALFPRRDSQK